MKSFGRQVLLVFLIWNLTAVFDGGSAYLAYTMMGRHLGMWSLAGRPFVQAWIWTLLTPMVLIISRRYPLSRARWVSSIAIHTAAFLALSGVAVTIEEWVAPPLLSMPHNFLGSRLLLRFLATLIPYLWMYWPLVCVQALIDSRAELVEQETRAVKLEAMLSSSQLALLRAQIQPHFLFNTLHAISTLVRTDAQAAENMIADLAGILRAAFSDPHAQEICLRSELELVRCYLRIQHCRYSDRMSVSYRIDEGALDAVVPALLLQSLVENAVTHGIAPLNRAATLEIQIARHDDRLLLQVADNGAGIAGDLQEGVGLSNARARLQRLYGMQQSFEIGGAPGQGTTVALSIPYSVQPEDASESPGNSHEDSLPYRRRRTPGAAEPALAAGH